MIVREAELRVALNIASSITDAERTLLQLTHTQAEAAIKKFLKYDPTQAVRTEYLPRLALREGTPQTWDTDRSRALMRPARGVGEESLQATYLPIRAVTSCLVDRNARYGQASGAFGAQAETWTQGSDYWFEQDQPGVGLSGIFLAQTSWPSEPGTVKLTYRAGYSAIELRGRADTSGTDENGETTTSGIDASPIWNAAMLTCIKIWHTYKNMGKQVFGGFVAGPKASERLGDYGYSLAASGSVAALTSMAISLPAEAAEALEEYVNYGMLVL